MFGRLLVGLDGSVQADVALEQAVVLARRFASAVVIAYVHEPGTPVDPALAERARFRVTAAGLRAEAVERDGEADAVLIELAREVGAVLVSRRGTTRSAALGRTTAALLRTAERCVVVCAGTPSPMRVCAVAVDDGDASRRALESAARFAAEPGSVLHVIHAASDEAGAQAVTRQAEAMLSLKGVAFRIHVRTGRPAEVAAALVRELRADALFTGAHVRRDDPGQSGRVAVSNTEEILTRIPIPVVVQP